MKIIGIELNHVLRNINRQILKYYDKEFSLTCDVDDIDEYKDLDKHVIFKSKKEKHDFFFVDYPYEIYGCANYAEKNLASKVVTWIGDLQNNDDEEVKVIFFSLDEEELSIQSSLFFLSKFGCRARKVIFPTSIDEVFNECDVVITADKRFLENQIPNEKKVVLIEKPFNEDVKEKATLSYGKMTEIISDSDFLNKLK